MLLARKSVMLLVLLLATTLGQPDEQALGSEEKILLAFKASVENWDEVYAARRMRGWQACEPGSCQPPCTWSGVSCSPFGEPSGGKVTSLELPCGRASCTVRARGRLSPQLAQLQHLQQLDLSGNLFYGELPEEWSYNGTFPQLTELNLFSNNLTGALPDAWAVNRAFPSLTVLNLADNRLSGQLPGSWATTNTSLISLMTWNLANNDLTGPLPPYINGLVTMLSVLFQGNRFSGTLPTGWGTQGWAWNNTYNSTQNLQELYLHDNLLTGDLPPEWGAPGAFTVLEHLTIGQNPLNSSFPGAWLSQGGWPALQTLNVSHAGLRGTLPPAEGSSMPSLRALVIDSNELSGSIPTSWTSMSALTWIEIQPGNPGLCTQPPANSNIQLCRTDERQCTTPLLPSSNPACNSSVGGGGDSGGSEAGAKGSTVPIAAIVAPICAAAALAAAAAVLVLRRRRRRAAAVGQLQLQPSGKNCGSTAASLEAGGAAPPLFPLSEMAFHEERSVWGGVLGRGAQAPTDTSKFPSSKVPTEDSVEAGPAAQHAVYAQHAQQAQHGRQGSGEAPPPSSRSSQGRSGSGCLPCLGWGEQDMGLAVRLSMNSAVDPTLRPSDSSLLRLSNNCQGLRLSNNSVGGALATPLPAPRGRPSFEAWRMGLAQQAQHDQQSSNTTGSTGGFGSGGQRGSSREWPWPHDTRPGMEGGSCNRFPSGGGSQGHESTSGEEQGWRTNPRPSFEMEAALLSDWELQPEEIEILKRPDGSPWQLGAGGFGTVFKALRNGVQPVAVKVLSGPIGEIQRMSQEEFAREISILRACRDTNIVQFQGVCLQPDKAMLVTEYMEGGNLFSNLRHQKVNWYRRGKRIAVEVARGMAFLHSKRIVHYDIKSANVLLTRDGTAKVSDMGMSRIMGDQSAVTGAIGTLAWSAPEMLWGQKCTTKADIYSFGIVLWEIVTGEVPVRGQLRDVRVPEECPEVVRDIILYCLEPNPSARPTAVQLVDWLLHAPATPPARHASSAPEADRPESSQGDGPTASPTAASAPNPAVAPSLPLEAGRPTSHEQIQQAQYPQQAQQQWWPQQEGRGQGEEAGQQAQQAQQEQAALDREQSLSYASPFAQIGAACAIFASEDASSPRPCQPPPAPSLQQQQAQQAQQQWAQQWGPLSTEPLSRQRTASGLLPVQAGLVNGGPVAVQRRQQALQRASSRIPSPFDLIPPHLEGEEEEGGQQAQQQAQQAMQRASSRIPSPFDQFPPYQEEGGETEEDQPQRAQQQQAMQHASSHLPSPFDHLSCQQAEGEKPL